MTRERQSPCHDQRACAGSAQSSIRPARRGPKRPQRMVEALRHRGPDGERCRRLGPLRSPTPGWRSSTSRAATSRSTPRTARSPRSSTGRSTTSTSCGASWRSAGTASRPTRTARWWSTATRSTGSTACAGSTGSSPSRSGTHRERRLVAARDAFGVKPLYWWTDGRRVALASEIGALLAAGLVEPRVDRVALDHYLACRFVPAPRTLFEGVSKLPAASTLVVEGAAAARRELARGARRAVRRRRRGRAGRPARRALHRRGRAPDDVRRPLRRLPVAAGSTRRPWWPRMARRARRARPPRSRSASRATATCSTSARPAAESARLIGTDHHDDRDDGDRLPRRARALRAAAGGALRHPERARADAALALRRRAREGGARRPGRRRAPRRLRPPPGRRASSTGCGSCPPQRAAPAAALARALPRAARARRTAHVLGGRGDAERLLRLVEITDAPVRRAARRAPGRRGRGRGERLDTARGVLGDVGRAAACSSRRSTSTPACSCPTGS